MNRTITLASVAVVSVVALAGCSQQNDQANHNEQKAQSTIQGTLDTNQPIPMATHSEMRQVLTDVENYQLKGVATTSFFYNQGVQNPIFVCPSIGFPIPTTDSLTNPHQISSAPQIGGGNAYDVLDQMEPTGIYAGDSTGTYVECVDPTGQRYAKYWEGFVDTIGGPAHWDAGQHQEVLDGTPTMKTTTK